MSSNTTIVALIAFLLATAAYGQLYPEHSVKKNSITVRGTGTYSFGSTIAVVKLQVNAAAKTALEVQQNLTKSEAKLVAYLTTQKVQKLEAAGVSLSTNTDYNKNPPVITGYSGHSSIAFEIPIARTGTILDGSLKNASARISSIRFKTPLDVIETARQIALKDAAQRARREAKAIARAMGKTLGIPLRVEVTDSFRPYESLHTDYGRYPSAVATTGSRVGGGGGFSNSLVGADQIVSASVSITYVLKGPY